MFSATAASKSKSAAAAGAGCWLIGANARPFGCTGATRGASIVSIEFLNVEQRRLSSRGQAASASSSPPPLRGPRALGGADDGAGASPAGSQVRTADASNWPDAPSRGLPHLDRRQAGLGAGGWSGSAHGVGQADLNQLSAREEDPSDHRVAARRRRPGHCPGGPFNRQIELFTGLEGTAGTLGPGQAKLVLPLGDEDLHTRRREVGALGPANQAQQQLHRVARGSPRGVRQQRDGRAVGGGGIALDGTARDWSHSTARGRCQLVVQDALAGGRADLARGGRPPPPAARAPPPPGAHPPCTPPPPHHPPPPPPP